MNQAVKIINFLRNNISKHPMDIVDVTAKFFKTTRVTVHRHLKKLIDKGEVIKTGKTRDTAYYLKDSMNKTGKFHISSDLEEFEVYSKYLKKAFSHLPKNVEEILCYGFTEIFNNAIDHSCGANIWMQSERVGNRIRLTITDDGVGVFKTIYKFFQLDDIYESVLQLSKGKMSTCPEYHSGEGLFFSARVFDTLEIFANNIHYVRDNKENDWALETCDTSKFGSKVIMTIAMDAQQNLVDVFKAYQSLEGLDFNRTDILVKLSKYKEELLISRSQAKRVLRDLEKHFKVVTLDFKGVALVGQGFVDEIFRVYKSQHPEIEFKYMNANKDIEFMIKRS